MRVTKMVVRYYNFLLSLYSYIYYFFIIYCPNHNLSIWIIKKCVTYSGWLLWYDFGPALIIDSITDITHMLYLCFFIQSSIIIDFIDPRKLVSYLYGVIGSQKRFSFINRA